METETPQTANGGTTVTPPSVAPSGPEAPQSKNHRLNQSTMLIGSVAILALGVVLGIGATKYVAGIPRATAATTKDTKGMAPPVAQPAPSPARSAAWNPFQEIRDVQLRMDRMFDDMTTQFRREPRLSLLPDNPGYSLSLKVQDLKDRYEVRAYLPNAKAADVKVSLLDKRTLKVEVTNQTTSVSNERKASERVTEWGQYAQIIELPAPVKGEQMKIDQPTHELIVTLPKA